MVSRVLQQPGPLLYHLSRALPRSLLVLAMAVVPAGRGQTHLLLMQALLSTRSLAGQVQATGGAGRDSSRPSPHPSVLMCSQARQLGIRLAARPDGAATTKSSKLSHETSTG